MNYLIGNIKVVAERNGKRAGIASAEGFAAGCTGGDTDMNHYHTATREAQTDD
jgi:hypothetical protein